LSGGGKKVIIVETPLRISFMGGGTDFEEFYAQNGGGAVLGTTINKRVYVIVKERFDDLICLNYSKREAVTSVDKINHDLIREAMLMTGVEKGVEITTLADIPSEGTGLGSSSAITVGLLHALYAYRGQIIPRSTLAEQACQIEINILGRPIGRQDQYFAAFGGLDFITFSSSGIVVRAFDIPERERRRLNESLLLFYTGITRQSSDILFEQRNNIQQQHHALIELVKLTNNAAKALAEGALEDFGNIVHQGWELKKKLASGITNPIINDIYEVARREGAVGGKITGAGGGGFFLFCCPNGAKDSVRNALRRLQELPFEFQSVGSRVIFNYASN
jgi:D-glycero-alpha-D-manno-heptose-7-phosphate kinase